MLVPGVLPCTLAVTGLVRRVGGHRQKYRISAVPGLERTDDERNSSGRRVLIALKHARAACTMGESLENCLCYRTKQVCLIFVVTYRPLSNIALHMRLKNETMVALLLTVTVYLDLHDECCVSRLRRNRGQTERDCEFSALIVDNFQI